jgi:hypothetical protein
LLLNRGFDDDLLFLLQYGGKDYTLENIRHLSMPIFLVRWIDKFSSDEFIRAFFLNIHYGEITSDRRTADDEVMTPIIFLEHDIGHFLGNFCYTTRHYDLAKMKHFFDFYQHCAATLPEPEFRKIRIYVFLQIHENNCHLDPNELITTRTMGTTTFFEYYMNTSDSQNYDTSGWDILRLSSERDLIKMVPKDIREVVDKSERGEKIEEYIFDCIRLYKEKYDEWNARSQPEVMSTLGGSSKRRVKKFRGRTTRVKKFKGKTTRKGKRHLGKV